MKRLVVALAVVVSSTLGAADRLHYSTIGAPDCGGWFRPEWRIANTSWLLGFLSGANGAVQQFVDRNLDVLHALQSSDQANLWMDNWCKANPLQSVSAGGTILFNELWIKTKKK